MIYHKMIYKWFTVEKTAAMCISMSSLLPLSGAAVFACLLSASSDWLTALWVARCQAYHWSRSGAFTLVNTAESCHVCSYSRAATRFQSLTTGCFWTLSYTVLMLVQVIAGQSANVGVTSRVTVRSLSKDQPLLWSLNLAWQMLHTTFVLTIVPSFCLLKINFPPNNPSAFSIFNSVSPSLLTAGTRRFRVRGKTPEVNKVALTALKYFIALISATIIS